METLGTDWLHLLSQITYFLAILYFIFFGLSVVRAEKPSKFVIGLLTVWVAFYPFVSICISLFILTYYRSNFLSSISGTPSASYSLFGFLNVVTVILDIALIVRYISHASKSPLVPDEDRIRYQMGFLFFSFIMMPLYYWKFIKNEPD